MMGRVTDRYCCLGCGRFWRTPQFEMVPGKNFCPYCGGTNWKPNVPLGSPPPCEERVVNTPCYHYLVVESFDNFNFCSICGNVMYGAIDIRG